FGSSVKDVRTFPDKVDATTAEGNSMSEAGNRTGPESEAENSIFEPLLRVKGVVIASIVLAVCVLALDLPFWFRAGLLAVVVLGAVWLASEVASSEPDEAPVKNI